MTDPTPKASVVPSGELDFQSVMANAPPAVQRTFVPQFMNAPIEVNKDVVVTGNKQTQTDFIARELKQATTSTSFGELEKNLWTAIKNLESTEVFKSVEAKIAAGDSPKDIKIHVDVEEKTRTKFHVGASTDFAKGVTTSTSMAIRNVFGHAEQLQGSVSLGPERYNFRGDFIKPRIGGSRWNLGVGAFREDDNFSAFSSFTLIGRGVDVRVFDTQKRHTFGVLQAWRDLVPTGRVVVSKQPGADGETIEVTNTLEPSASIVKAASPSLKSAVYHEYICDRRDSPTTPHTGTYFKIRTELAGLGGDVRFAKSDAFWKTYFPLGKWLTIGMSARVGVAQPWSAVFPSLQVVKGWNEDVPIPDRLFMGGPTSLRGFSTHSVGPSSEGDALGGNLAAQTGLSLAYQFPPRFRILHDIGLRLQTYVDSGNTVSLADGKAIDPKVRELFRESRVAAGCGVMLPIPQLGGRLEINYNWPLYARPGDSIQQFQIGLGFEF